MTHVSFFIAKNVSIRNLLQYIIFPFFILLKCGVFVAVVDLMRIVRKPVFGVSDQVTHKPGRTAIRVARGLKFRRDCSSCRAKTKALISCAVDLGPLICGFVFAYIYESRCEKTGLRGFRPGPTQTRLYSQRRWLEA